MSQTAALACAVIGQAMDDIEIYLRSLQRVRIRNDEIGGKRHRELMAVPYSPLLTNHRIAVDAAAFLTGADSHADVNRLWFEASGMDFLKYKEKVTAMYPIKEILLMG